MGVRTLPGNPEIAVKLRKNARARRMTLRVSRIDGAVTVTIPRGISERKAMAFAEEQRDWVLTQLSKQAERVLVGAGQTLPIAGTDVQLVTGTSKRLKARGTVVELPLPEETGRKQLLAWVRGQARAELARASDHYASKLGKPYTRLTLRDTRSRWGSCSAAGALMYSWRLVLAPRPVMDYVAAHEVAHLVEMNHSRAFWKLVEELYGPYSEPRQWLRREGQTLHRYRFGT